jgi:hypothetical protein
LNGNRLKKSTFSLGADLVATDGWRYKEFLDYGSVQFGIRPLWYFIKHSMPIFFTKSVLVSICIQLIS